MDELIGRLAASAGGESTVAEKDIGIILNLFLTGMSNGAEAAITAADESASLGAVVIGSRG